MPTTLAVKANRTCAVASLGAQLRPNPAPEACATSRPRIHATTHAAPAPSPAISRKQLRGMVKSALGTGLVLLAATAFGGKKTLKAHAALGVAFIALAAWHATLYRANR